MKMLKLAFIYKKHDTFRYVNFFIQKLRHLAKSKTICVTFYIQKSGHFALRDFHGILKLAEGRAFLFKNPIYFALRIYIEKQCTLRYVFT